MNGFVALTVSFICFHGSGRSLFPESARGWNRGFMLSPELLLPVGRVQWCEGDVTSASDTISRESMNDCAVRTHAHSAYGDAIPKEKCVAPPLGGTALLTTKLSVDALELNSNRYRAAFGGSRSQKSWSCGSNRLLPSHMNVSHGEIDVCIAHPL